MKYPQFIEDIHGVPSSVVVFETVELLRRNGSFGHEGTIYFVVIIQPGRRETSKHFRDGSCAFLLFRANQKLIAKKQVLIAILMWKV